EFAYRHPLRKCMFYAGANKIHSDTFCKRTGSHISARYVGSLYNSNAGLYHRRGDVVKTGTLRHIKIKKLFPPARLRSGIISRHSWTGLVIPKGCWSHGGG